MLRGAAQPAIDAGGPASAGTESAAPPAIGAGGPAGGPSKTGCDSAAPPAIGAGGPASAGAESVAPPAIGAGGPASAGAESIAPLAIGAGGPASSAGADSLTVREVGSSQTCMKKCTPTPRCEPCGSHSATQSQCYRNHLISKACAFEGHR